jgi:hypothetical protein
VEHHSFLFDSCYFCYLVAFFFVYLLLVRFLRLSHGALRSVFYAETSFGDEIAAKFLKSPNLPFSVEQFDNIRRDAMVMERLTESPIIVDMYGFCGTSIYSELLPREVEMYVVPGEGFADADSLDDEDDVKPRNNYTVTEKLEMALQMAETLAVLHGFKDGVIIHDDVQLCQWLYTRDGKLKLNDFNRAEIRMYDSETGKYCPHQNGHGMGNVSCLFCLLFYIQHVVLFRLHL